MIYLSELTGGYITQEMGEAYCVKRHRPESLAFYIYTPFVRSNDCSGSTNFSFFHQRGWKCLGAYEVALRV